MSIINYETLKLEITKEIPELKKFIDGCFLREKQSGNLCKITNPNKDLYSNSIYDFGNGKCDVVSNPNFDYEKFYNVIGIDPMLNDVLKWHSLNGRDKYSHFEVSKGEAYFSIYEGEETESIIWDLSQPLLKYQSSELLEWLVNIA